MDEDGGITSTERLTETDVEEVRALAAAVAAGDGVEALSEQTLLNLPGAGRPVRHLLAREGADLVGYAQTDPGGPSAELAVHPGHRRRGHGRALLDRVRADAPGAAVWAHGDLPAARALAAAAGMERVRELLFMSMDLSASPSDAGDGAGGTGAAVLRDRTGAVVRVDPFRTGVDEDAWVRVNARAFAGHPEQGRMTVADLRARQAEDWFDPDLLWLVRPGGQAGAAEPAADPLAAMWIKVVPGTGEGEIYAVGVDPAAQGRGLGALLTARAVDAMRARGLERATLYVEGDNGPALATYARAGFSRAAVHAQYR